MAEDDVTPGGDSTGTPGGDGGAMDSWRSGLPQEIRDNEHLSRYGTLEEAAKGIIEAQKFISSTRPTVPKEDAPPEEWDKFYGGLGRPEKPEGYELAKPEELPEGFPYDENLEKKWRDWAHKAGLTAKQARDIYGAYLAANIEYFNQVMAQANEREAKVTELLKKTWGAKYDVEMKLAQKVAQTYIKSPEDWEALAFALNNDERLVLLFNRIGKDLSEDVLHISELGAVVGNLREKAQKLMMEATKLGPGHLDYQAKMDEARRIYEQIEKEEAAAR
jgi:hypothetical protein